MHSHDGLLRMAFYSPLRCRECQHRFWKFSLHKPLAALILLGGLVGVTAWLARQDQPATPVIPMVTIPSTPAEATKGDAESQLALGLRYAEGDGVIQNSTEAAKWFALAAKQGLAEAQYQYGLALLDGRGVVQDYQAAFSWIEKPAKRGYAKAQYSLGELYRYGTGTAIDKARAYLWFNLAAAQGVDVATKARDGLVWQLKPEQIAAMQEEARRMSLGEKPVTPAAPPPPSSSTETPPKP